MKLICITPQKDNEPIIYLKPDTALLRNNDAFYLPEFSQQIKASPALVIKIKKIGKNIAERFANRYYDEISVGFNFVALDVLQQNRSEHKPWDNAVGFDFSAPIGTCIEKKEAVSLQYQINNTPWQEISINNINIDEYISKISHLFTLKIGDYIFVTLTDNNKLLTIGQSLSASINNKENLHFAIK